jgi:chromate reductase, NAD(P)H dehydrogenase (quinone)
VLYEGVGGLPHFNSTTTAIRSPGAVADLRYRIGTADPVVLSNLEYAGVLPGSFKSHLDWTIRDDHPAAANQKAHRLGQRLSHGAVNAHESLRKVLSHATAEIIEQACPEVPVTDQMVDDDGPIAAEYVRSHHAALLETLAAHVRSIHDEASRRP